MHLFDETEPECWTEEAKLFNEFQVLSLNPKKTYYLVMKLIHYKIFVNYLILKKQKMVLF